MKNVLHKKKLNAGTVQVHVDPPPISLIESKSNEKLDKDCVKIKLRRYPTSQNSDLCQFKVALFDNDNPEEFLFFISNINITIEASGTLVAVVNIQYLHKLVC